MPTTPGDNDDPVIASYEVYISSNEQHVPSEASNSAKAKLLVLQYPSHRAHSKPYNADRSQKPTALRLKPETGLLEVDIPILTQEHYNDENGARYRKALEDSNKFHSSGTYGLAGGFNTIHSAPGLQPMDLRDIPSHEDHPELERPLETQTLGGKIVTPMTRDPIYMVGTFHKDQLHLSHVDAVVQTRPQLHHLDAQDELTQRRTAASLSKAKTGDDVTPVGLESKAIDIKIKDNKDDAKDRSLNANARLLRTIQNEPWQVYNWVDQDEDASQAKFREIMRQQFANPLENGTIGASATIKLRSAISNSEWLDKMSAPRDTGHGKKGLLAKLRGRERERARRKKHDEERRRAAKEFTQATGIPSGASNLFDHGSESSDLSSLSGSESDASEKGKDVEMVDLVADDEVEIKEEPSMVAAAPAAVPTIPDSLEVTGPASTKQTPRRRGRPPRNSQVAGAIEIDD